MEEPCPIKDLVDDATFDFTMGEEKTAIAKLTQITLDHPSSFEAWHALSEVEYSLNNFENALSSAEKAYQLKPDDLFINTTLSRIWVEKGDKEKAEHFGAQAKMQGWKEQIQNPSDAQTGIDL
ncbi:hypothetical protein MLD52_14525 [Puniceicoccaceae bacterium K14]|nr:hypothetical protein [Puniceicoccaceae bacterium K14]